MAKRNLFEKDLTKEKAQNQNQIVIKTTQYQINKLNEMKKDLDKYILNRKKKFAKEYNEFIEKNTMDGQLIPVMNKVAMNDIIAHTFAPLIKVAGITPSYSADEISLAFDFYVECSLKLNETSYYVPKVEDFCRLINISQYTFENYRKNSSDENMREVCNKIVDWCSARLADIAFSSKDKAIITYGIFHQKASNNKRDNDPIQNNTYIQNNNIMTDEEFSDLASKFSNS